MRSRQNTFATFVATGLVVFVSACGGSPGSKTVTSQDGTASASETASSAPASTSTKGGSATDGCALITEQEATTALGTDPGPGTPQNQKSGSVTARGCSYSASGGSLLSITAITPISRTSYDDGRTRMKAQAHGTTVQDLTGVGDAAYLALTASGGGCIVLKGSVMATITLVSRTPLASPVDTLTSVCKAAAGRL